MSQRLQTRKYVFTVEGETERWYLLWLRDQINVCDDRTYNVSIDAKVQQSPKKFYKGVTAKTTPAVTHICDYESNESVHVEKFRNILSEMKEAKDQKGIKYSLGYSNFTFELWMVLHKRACNGTFSHRTQYLAPISQAFGEKFEDLGHYKREDNFKRYLSKLTLQDVKDAIRRADAICAVNESDEKCKLQHYKGYAFYKDNPALSIHEAVRIILSESGLL